MSFDIRARGIGLLLASAVNLGACASIDSRPEPISSVGDTEAIFKNCTRVIATRLIDRADDDGKIDDNTDYACRNANTTQKARNSYINAAMDLIDARYKSFIVELSQESKGSNLGLNFLALVATAGASVASENTANKLATGATALIGTRDAFNKDALYEKTIAALIDEMYTMRADARAAILTGLTKSYAEYPIELAARDIEAYDEAADLNRAIQRLIRGAAERADEAGENEKELKQVLQGCIPEKNTFVARSRIRKYLVDVVPANATGDAQIASIATSLKIDTKGKDREAQTTAILEKMAKEACTLETMTEIATTWDSSIKLTGD